MSLPSQNYTATMARLFAEQGYLRKAVQIYRYLLEQAPHRDDLREALVDLERRIEQQEKPSIKELGLLLRDWKDWIEEYKKMKRQRRI